MNVAVIGTGYVGLVSGVCLAAKGHRVVCVDVNPQVVASLKLAHPTIYEQGLPDLLQSVVASGNFDATLDLHQALDGAEIVLIAVGTPSEDGAINLDYVRSAARSVGEYLRSRDVYLSVVVKSTVVPGTTDTVVRDEIERASGKTMPAFGLGMNPEFLREGQAIGDFMNPDRIVLGSEDHETLRCLEALYAPWAVDKVRVNSRTAELIKYANNALLATQISAINEIANLAAAIGGIDVMDVVRGVHSDRRWNPILPDGTRINPSILSYLVPGCGFGGSCFPKDVQALRTEGMRRGLAMDMLDAVLDVNDAQPSQVTAIMTSEDRSLEGKAILVLGLAFKPGTDDVREAASLRILPDLIAAGARIVAHDPVATPNFRRAFGSKAETVRFVKDWKSEVHAADAVIVITPWPDYLDLPSLDLTGKTVFDARRAFRPDGFPGARYMAIGRRIAPVGLAARSTETVQ